MAVKATITFNAGEKYVTPTTASTDRAMGVCMVTASPRGKPCPVQISGIALVRCQSTTGTMGFPAVCCATAGQVRTAGAITVAGATANSRELGLFAENFSSKTAGDKVKVLINPGRR
jgi:hypothetical protein